MCWRSYCPGFSSSSVLWRGRFWHINTKWITLRAVCGSGNAKLSLGGRLVEGFKTLALMKCIWRALFLLSDISEMESYRSYSPQDDQRSRQSDISSHSSNELPRESARYAQCWDPKLKAHLNPLFQTNEQISKNKKTLWNKDRGPSRGYEPPLIFYLMCGVDWHRMVLQWYFWIVKCSYYVEFLIWSADFL